MDTYSINPASIIDEAVDLSMRLAGTDFPVSIFPTKIQRIISEVHECHNYPTDYIAAAILTAIAVGIGNTHLAQIKQGWIESPILYIALMGRPGANKSHPLSFAMKLFLDYDYQQNQVFEKALAKYDELMSMSRKPTARMPRVPSSSNDRISRLSALFKRRFSVNWLRMSVPVTDSSTVFCS